MTPPTRQTTSPTIDVFPFWILLGTPASEPVPKSRYDFYEWIAKQILPRRRLSVHQPTESVSLSFEEIRTQPGFVGEWLLAEEPDEDEAIVLVDLSSAPYVLMREPLLQHLAEAAVSIAAPSGRAVAIALPGSAPASTSLLWVPMEEADAQLQGSIVVVDEKGALATFGSASHLPDSFAVEYRKRSAALHSDLAEAFDNKLLRRLGHFDLGAAGGCEDECSNYFFDAADCVDELATMLERRVESIRRRSKKGPWTLVLCPSEADWVQEAAILVSSRTEIALEEWPKRAGRRVPKALVGRRLILLFDVVRSGRTARKVLETIDGWAGVEVALAYAAVGPRQTLRNLPGGLRLEVASKANMERTPRSECEQCQLGLPFTPWQRDAGAHQLRAFDLWSMLLSVDWNEEGYGPEGGRFESSPNFEQIFDEYGDYLAYRYQEALSNFDDSEIVVVSPDEPGVNALMRRLRTRLDNRLVSVGIPRPIIEEVRLTKSKRQIGEILDANIDQAWVRQLRNVQEKRESVVMVDEFNGSGGTARAILDLLVEARVQVRGFLPLVDRKPEIDLGSVAIKPLYEIPRPRP